jgi:hypothetical protein
MTTDLLNTQRTGYTSARPGAGFRFSPWRRGNIGDMGTIYPNPFLDVAQNYMPKSVVDMFGQCEYYAQAHPLISAIILKMSAYGITDLLYETSNEGLRGAYRYLFEQKLRIRQFLVECLMDYHAYGNCFVSVIFPFKKFLKCRSCGIAVPIHRAKYRFSNYKFRLNCRSCGHQGEAGVEDRYYASPEEVKLVRWYPKHISIERLDTTGETIYKYRLPLRLKNSIVMGKPAVIERTPQIFLNALKKNRAIIFRKDHIFHMKRSTVSREDQAWGCPMILPVLKEAFYLQILRKGQEAVALDHTVPLRVIYPQQSTADSNPYANISIGDWQEATKKELARWRRDPNYIPVMPLPLGYQSIGGDGRALLLHQEIRVWSEHICAGLGVPVEFVFGGLSYSGSSVSLRMLENQFMGLREDTIDLAGWIRDRVINVIRWPRVPIEMKPFKMADDLQRAAFDFQLVGAKMLSKRTLLESRDHDYLAERHQVNQEVQYELDLTRRQQLFNAETQGQSQEVSAQHQVKAMQIQQQGQPMQPQPGQEQGQQQGQTAAQFQGQQPGAPAQPGQTQPGQQGQPQGQLPAQAGQAGQGGRPAIGPGGIVGVMQSPINQERLQAGMQGTDMRLVAAQIAQQIQQMTDFDRAAFLNDLEAQNPDLHWIVMQYLNRQTGGAAAEKPLPEQLPPRRGPENALI